jgi:hypothetical protein
MKSFLSQSMKYLLLTIKKHYKQEIFQVNNGFIFGAMVTGLQIANNL